MNTLDAKQITVFHSGEIFTVVLYSSIFFRYLSTVSISTLYYFIILLSHISKENIILLLKEINLIALASIYFDDLKLSMSGRSIYFHKTSKRSAYFFPHWISTSDCRLRCRSCVILRYCGLLWPVRLLKLRMALPLLCGVAIIKCSSSDTETPSSFKSLSCMIRWTPQNWTSA